MLSEVFFIATGRSTRSPELEAANKDGVEIQKVKTFKLIVLLCYPVTDGRINNEIPTE